MAQCCGRWRVARTSVENHIHGAAVAMGSGEARLTGLAASTRGPEVRIVATPVGRTTGTTGALIVVRFRARLPAQVPAMAASKASRSTQQEVRLLDNDMR